jgi:hypothetical protein
MVNTNKMKRILAAAVVVVMLVPSVALAQSSSDKGYGGPNNVVQGLDQGGGNGPGGPSATPTDSGNAVKSANNSSNSNGRSLPFTGADLGVLAAVGGLLLATGFGLRRLTQRPFEA